MAGMFKRLFSVGRKSPNPYVDGGTALLHHLITTLSLPGWKDLLPLYTPKEAEVIQSELSHFQRLADSEAGDGAQGSTYFHPDAASEIRRVLTAQGLCDFAERSWRFVDEMPEDWRAVASTYLKAWASNLAPLPLQGLSELLIKVGYRTEAKATLNVLLLFPSYADKFSGEKDKGELARLVVAEARRTVNEL